MTGTAPSLGVPEIAKIFLRNKEKYNQEEWQNTGL